jgi:hypothetical protein
VRMMVLGDDNVTYLSKELGEKVTLESWQDFNERLGMKVEARLHQDMTTPKLEYCSGWFCPMEVEFDPLVDENTSLAYNETYVWMPKTARVLSKTFTLFDHEHKPRGVFMGIALGLHKYPLDPILAKVVETIIERLDGTRPVFPPWQYRVDDYNPMRITGDPLDIRFRPTRRSLDAFCERYSMSEAQVKKVEGYVARKFKGKFPVNLSTKEEPLLLRMIEVDLDMDVSGDISWNFGMNKPNVTHLGVEQKVLNDRHAQALNAPKTSPPRGKYPYNTVILEAKPQASAPTPKAFRKKTGVATTEGVRSDPKGTAAKYLKQQKSEAPKSSGKPKPAGRKEGPAKDKGKEKEKYVNKSTVNKPKSNANNPNVNRKQDVNNKTSKSFVNKPAKTSSGLKAPPGGDPGPSKRRE